MTTEFRPKMKRDIMEFMKASVNTLRSGVGKESQVDIAKEMVGYALNYFQNLGERIDFELDWEEL
jgi:hypothetical protein